MWPRHIAWPKRNESARPPGLRLPREAGRQRGPESVQQRHHDRCIRGIYLVYTAKKQVFRINSDLFLSLGRSLHVFTCVDVYPFFWDLLKAGYTLKIRINSKISMKLGIYLVYAHHIPGML